MIRMIAVDLDGTLMNSKGEMPPDFQKWVTDHPEIITVIASGRQYYTLLDNFPEIGDKAVFMAENGAMIGRSGTIFHTDCIQRDILERTVSVLEQLPDVYLILAGAESAYLIGKLSPEMKAPGIAFHRLREVSSFEEAAASDTLFKVAVYCPGMNASELYASLRNLPEGVVAYISGPEWIDVMRCGTDKGSGLRMVMKRFEVSPNECMAFGDLMNDVAMLRTVQYSFAVANASREAKEAARYETSSNDEDGVMRILRRIGDFGSEEEE